MTKEKINYGTMSLFPVSTHSLGVIIPADIVKGKKLKAKDPVQFIGNGGDEITIRIRKKE